MLMSTNICLTEDGHQDTDDIKFRVNLNLN